MSKLQFIDSNFRQFWSHDTIPVSGAALLWNQIRYAIQYSSWPQLVSVTIIKEISDLQLLQINSKIIEGSFTKKFKGLNKMEWQNFISWQNIINHNPHWCNHIWSCNPKAKMKGVNEVKNFKIIVILCIMLYLVI
jgi:hypothetical protein